MLVAAFDSIEKYAENRKAIDKQRVNFFISEISKLVKFHNTKVLAVGERGVVQLAKRVATFTHAIQSSWKQRIMPEKTAILLWEKLF